MRTIFAIAVTSVLALAAPALAQQAGAPGATGAGGSLTGSNPPGTAGVTTAPHTGTRSMNKMNNGMSEGRAAAPDANTPGTTAEPDPNTVRGGQSGQDNAK